MEYVQDRVPAHIERLKQTDRDGSESCRERWLDDPRVTPKIELAPDSAAASRA